MMGIPDDYSQNANPYQGRGRRSFQDDPRQRALASAVAGGQQPQIPSGANQPPPARATNPMPNGASQQPIGTSPAANNIRTIQVEDEPPAGMPPGSVSALPNHQMPSRHGREMTQPALDPRGRALNLAIGGQGSQGPVGGPPPVLDQPLPGQSIVDTSKWNTDGYAIPGYTASKVGGPPAGWDATKWADPNHQTPKYVMGRILGEAAGEDGLLQDAAERDLAVKHIMAAYPGATFDGKDKITMPDGSVIDIFEGAGAGLFRPSYQLQEGTGKDAAGNPLPVAPAGGGADLYAARRAARMPWESNNTQEGGDALQAIYQLLGPLMAQISQGNALQNVLKGGGA